MTTAFIYRDLDMVADWLQMYATELRSTAVSGDVGRQSVLTAVQQDRDLTVQQRVALEELYLAFREVTRGRRSRT